MATESVTGEVVQSLVDHFKKEVSGIAQVLAEWPSANIRLKYPAISVTTQAPDYTPVARYISDSGAIGTNKKKPVKYVIGQYDFNLQVDIWARNKEERNEFYEKFFQSFNAQNPSGGLSLVLKKYHEIFCRYDMTGYRYEDSEIGSQTQEWRAIVSVTANCKAIIERNEPVMETLPSATEIETEGEISETVVVTE